ncbi:hypothetical protein BDV95DRAFT_572297 [Massariosphaeria phaeospora]|uniref:RING-type domain-containing protein n=1 Tax=Massariosphaeria phaeospora TaxID=100035 RepID=A0A7C8IF95_9PLEO|nr:hypothetical protein BDV95DRAFT_572297 [Massariosphaeria phaeospora]
MQCCFCLDEYQIGAELLVCLNVCEHSFHSSCLQDWLNTTHPGQVFVVCPLCRREICVAREMRLARTVPQA